MFECRDACQISQNLDKYLETKLLLMLEIIYFQYCLTLLEYTIYSLYAFLTIHFFLGDVTNVRFHYRMIGY